MVRKPIGNCDKEAELVRKLQTLKDAEQKGVVKLKPLQYTYQPDSVELCFNTQLKRVY